MWPPGSTTGCMRAQLCMIVEWVGSFRAVPEGPRAAVESNSIIFALVAKYCILGQILFNYHQGQRVEWQGFKMRVIVVSLGWLDPGVGEAGALSHF